jgi:hypothetical protein
MPRPISRRRGVVQLCAFFAFIGALALLLHAGINQGLRRIKTSKFGSLNQVMSGRVNADIIINGSSRALVHYDPRIISAATGLSAYNLGMNGIQTDVQAAVLKAYLNKNKKPQLVVQNLEAFTFEATRPGEIYDPAAYIPYLKDAEFFEDLRKVDPAVWKWKHIPLYGYVVEDLTFTWFWGLAGLFGYSGPENYFRGFNPRYKEWTEDFARFLSIRHEEKVEYRIDARAVSALTEILRICREMDIPVVLVFSPEYIGMQQMAGNRATIFAEFQKLAQTYQAELWDYSADPICRDVTYFYNSQHLNARGAAIFSNHVSARISRALGTMIIQGPKR